MLMKNAGQSLFNMLQGKKMLGPTTFRKNPFASTKTFKGLDIGSVMPDIPMLDLDTMNYTSVFDLCSTTQLAVIEFYVSKTRTAEPVIAIDP